MLGHFTSQQQTTNKKKKNNIRHMILVRLSEHTRKLKWQIHCHAGMSVYTIHIWVCTVHNIIFFFFFFEYYFFPVCMQVDTISLRRTPRQNAKWWSSDAIVFVWHKFVFWFGRKLFHFIRSLAEMQKQLQSVVTMLSNLQQLLSNHRCCFRWINK